MTETKSNGRFCLHLIEGKDEDDSPFVFAITFARPGKDGKDRHVFLNEAMKLGADALRTPLKLLSEASKQREWLRDAIAAGNINEPQPWTPDQAMDFIQESEDLKQAGLEVRVPDWSSKIPKVSAKLEIGKTEPSHVGRDALLDFEVSATLSPNEPPLSDAEIRRLAEASEKLVLIRGRWVRPDRKMLEELAELRRIHGSEGMDMFKALRLLGTGKQNKNPELEIEAGEWIGEWRQRLTAPEPALREIGDPSAGLDAELRPYQQAGVQWMLDLRSLGLGGILADDMGLGKTIQVLGLANQRGQNPPMLLIVPASLLGNWDRERQKFASWLNMKIAHSSATNMKSLADLPEAEARKWLSDCDIMMTTYGTAQRIKWLPDIVWGTIVLDEAQAVKNPAAAVTRFVRKLKAKQCLALTGTPIENRIHDLWSLMNFANPGLLGKLEEFRESCNQMKAQNDYSPLKDLLRPYLLRRSKTDKSIVPDLPDKSEMPAICHLSRKQASLYSNSVEEMRKELEAAKKTGIERHGVVVKYLTRLKQICNHPSNWSHEEDWNESDSGKFQRLRELAESIADAGDKMLVFTQYKYMTAPLADFLTGVFDAKGLVLHGDTPVNQRQNLVQEFQENPDTRFMVLSLKAGGTGLNLTAANHVVHFDRWWNPAVENQATDRAFRIGQHRNVLVHQFVVPGTLEERIDAMLRSKQKLSQDILGSGSEISLTGMDNEELLELVSLDLERAMTGI